MTERDPQTERREEPLFCGDCKHPEHSGPCPVLHLYDRPGGYPGNQQCLCGHEFTRSTITAPDEPASVARTEGLLDVEEALTAVQNISCDFYTRSTRGQNEAMRLVKQLWQNLKALEAKATEYENDKQYLVQAGLANEWEDRYQIQQEKIAALEREVGELRGARNEN